MTDFREGGLFASPPPPPPHHPSAVPKMPILNIVKYTCLKALKPKNLASLSPFSVFDVKPLYTHWYCWPGDLAEPCSHFDIPNCYNVEKICSTCLTGQK